jgi:pyruvate dehydrogenase (quinone)
VTVRGASYQQELNLDRMFADVAGFAQEASAPAQVRHLIDRCIMVAKAKRAVGHHPPKDIQDENYEESAVAHGFTRSGVGYRRPKIVPEDADLAQAAEILNAGTKVAILIGAGARGTSPLLIEMATLLGAGVAKALLGKDVLPDDLPFVTGAIGLLGTEPSWDLMQGCDTLLMVGTGFPWSEFLPKDGSARAVQIDIEASMLSLRYPAEVNLHGDAAATLKALLPLIKRKDARDWSKTIETNVSAWWKKLEGRATAEASPREPAARRLGDVPLAAGKCRCHKRQRILRQLVCPRLPGAARPVSVAFRRPGLDGRGCPVRHRR